MSECEILSALKLSSRYDKEMKAATSHHYRNHAFVCSHCLARVGVVKKSGILQEINVYLMGFGKKSMSIVSAPAFSKVFALLATMHGHNKMSKSSRATCCQTVRFLRQLADDLIHE